MTRLFAGYLHGFDKFMNLVLMNVDESYTVMVRVPHPYTVTVDEPADPQPLQPLFAMNPNTGAVDGHYACRASMYYTMLSSVMSFKTIPFFISCFVLVRENK